tara:strand:- start:10 stop:813 length:804 start_codon:yes stop_codon:yes gene_type:complete
MIFFFIVLINLTSIKSIFYNNFKKTVGGKIVNNKYLFNYPKYIVNNKNTFIDVNNYKNPDKIITLAPSGLYGFYTYGISTVLKNRIDLDKYVINGVSSGSWNGLYLAYKGNDFTFNKNLLEADFNSCKNIIDFQIKMKNTILNNYKITDFNTNKLFITVNGYHEKEMKTLFYTDFDNLEDMVDCCIGSSNIPYISGDIIYNYRDILAFDGGFCENPYLIDKSNSSFHVCRKTYGRYKDIDNSFDLNINLMKLYENGVKDAKKNNLKL